MSLSLCVNDLGFYDLSVFHFVYFKLFCVSKMLKYLSVFIRYRNFHDLILLFLIFCLAYAFLTLSPIFFAVFTTAGSATQNVISTVDLKGDPLDQKPRQLLSGSRVDHLHRRSAHLHARRTRFLCKCQMVDQTDRLIFFHGHRNSMLFFRSCRIKMNTLRHTAYPSFLLGSRHPCSSLSENKPPNNAPKSCIVIGIC